MVATEIRLWDAILSGIFESKFFLKDVNAVRPCNTAEGIEQDLEIRMLLCERLDEIKVEDLFHVVDIVLSGMDDLDREGSIFLCTNIGKVNIRELDNLVGREVLGGLKDLVRDALWSRSAVGKVVLDAEIFGWS